MAVLTNCLLCRKLVQVPEEMLGKTVNCPRCGGNFEANRPPQGGVPANAGMLGLGVICFRALALVNLLSAMGAAAVFVFPSLLFPWEPSRFLTLIGLLLALLAVGCNLALGEALKVFIGLARANSKLLENTLPGLSGSDQQRAPSSAARTSPTVPGSRAPGRRAIAPRPAPD